MSDDESNYSDDDVDVIMPQQQQTNISNDPVQNVIIRGENRTSMNEMTEFEFVRIIGTRAEMIEDGNPPNIEITEKLQNPLEIAEAELIAEKCPLVLRREHKMNSYIVTDEFDVNSMRLPNIEFRTGTYLDTIYDGKGPIKLPKLVELPLLLKSEKNDNE